MSIFNSAAEGSFVTTCVEVEISKIGISSAPLDELGFLPSRII